MRELEEMPNHYSHTIYKEYVEMIKDESKKQAHQNEEVGEQLVEAFGGQV